MKIKTGFFLQQVGNEYMAVAVGEIAEQFSGIIRINAAGEFLWRMLEKGATEDELIAAMMARYDDLDESTARADLAEFLDTIKLALEQ